MADPSTTSPAARVRDLWSLRGRYRVLHLTWFAFFLTFVVCTAFALATSFEMLVVSRLALSVVGAGFVVGIRMVSEWFPPREVGTAEGVYGGWGNFGAAAAAFALPLAAGWLGGEDGWRWATGGVGVVAAAYGLVYLRSVTDTPGGAAYARPRRQGALEVTQRPAVWGLAALTAPLAAVLGLVAWRVWREGVLSDAVLVGVTAGVVVLLIVQEIAVFRVNRPALAGAYPPEDRYPFRTVAALCAAYFATFGAELALVTLLPEFFEDTWSLGPAAAGAAASRFAFTNLVARPGGGLLSDVLGSRRRTLAGVCAGTAAGFLVLSTVGPSWPWVAAVAACMACSLFVQAGAGATFGIAPLVKKRVSGQVAGIVGAYGNIGALVFLTAGILASTRVVFLAIAGAAVAALVATRFVVEPTGEVARVRPAAPASATDAGVAGVAVAS